MSETINIGILGCARIARRGVIRGIQQSGVARLAAISSRRAETAKSWAAEFNIPKAYDSYEALLADPEIDAVYNPLPNELHGVWTLKAAEAGKHVLCEKPIAREVAEAEAMVAGCRRHGVVLMEAFMWRHHPRTMHALEMIRAGQLGDLRLVSMDFAFDIDRDDWRMDPKRGGGALFDVGCYGLNAARLFTGAEPADVHAQGTFAPSGVDMTLNIALTFPNNVGALIHCSFECPYQNRLKVVGTKGILEFTDGVLPEPQTTLIHRTDAGTETLEFAGDQYVEEIKAFATGVRNGKLPLPAEDGLANLRAITRIAAAAKSPA